MSDKEQFEMIDISVSEKRMKVLAALLSLSTSSASAVGFEELYEKIGNYEGGHPGAKPLIYRSLTSLEEEGYLSVNRSSYRHEYWTEFHMIRKALDKRKNDTIQNAEREKQELQNLQREIDRIDLGELAARLVLEMSGKKQHRKPRYALGPESTYWLIDNEIYDKARSGDVIRFTMDWIDPTLEHEMNRQTRGDELLKRGVEIRSLLSKESLEDETVYERRAEVYRDWMEKDRKLNVRIRLESSRTYQFVSLNSDGIVLIVAENPLTATWIPRKANPSLVEDAITRFDADFDSAFDPSQVFGNRGEQ
ncbi:MAG: hypothetical protein RTU92_05255 [Candidatus Thorarchaeota archaeon]